MRANRNHRVGPGRRDGADQPPRASIGALAVAALCLVLTLAAAGAARARRPARITVAQAEQIGLQGYVYGVPLLAFLSATDSQTSVTVPDALGDAPVNQLGNARALASPTGQALVAPNDDTLYSPAHLDLAQGPFVLHVPKVAHDRYYSFEFISPYTNVFAYVGTRTTGDGAHDFLIAGPGFHGRAPRGMRVIRSPFNLVWMLGRTLVLGPTDLGAVHGIQNGYRLVPWRAFQRLGLRWRPPRPSRVVATPVQSTVPTGLAFFDALGQALAASPPPAADAPILATLRAVGIGPGLEPTQEHLPAAVLAGLVEAAAAGPGEITRLRGQLTASSIAANAGWFVPPADTGDFGTDYDLRAVIAVDGLGANRPAEAVYAVGFEDSTLTPLDGVERYEIHFPAGALPPARYFWSLTMYDSLFLLVSNPLDRYAISNRTPGLRYNPDGSLDLYLSSSLPPEGESNWLPAPRGPFEVTLRLYGPRASVLDGSYRYPPIVRLDSSAVS